MSYPLISNNRFAVISLMDLSLSLFTEFDASFSLERSQGDMLKFDTSSRISIPLISYALDVDALRNDCLNCLNMKWNY